MSGASGSRRRSARVRARGRRSTRSRAGHQPAAAGGAVLRRAGRLRRPAARAHLAADLLHRRLGRAPAPARVQPRRLLHRHAGHPSMGLVAVYKAIQAIFGMEDLTPYAVASTLVLPRQRRAAVRLDAPPGRRLAGARRRRCRCSSSAPALEDLLTPFQIGFFAPVACGIGACWRSSGATPRRRALLRAARGRPLLSDPRARSVVAGVAVAIGLDGELRARSGSRSCPAALYALWYLGWGDSDANQFSSTTWRRRPRSSSTATPPRSPRCSGSPRPATRSSGALDWGRPLLALAVIAVAARLVALGRVPKWLWVVLAAGVVFWLLTAINATYGRSATPRATSTSA